MCFLIFHQKSAVNYLQRIHPGQKAERIFIDWTWWILAGLPFPHLIRVMDCFFHEGMKVFYRIALAILILYQKHAPSTPTLAPATSSNANEAASTSTSTSTSKNENKMTPADVAAKFGVTGYNSKGADKDSNDIENTLPNFCRNLPVSPTKLLKTAFNIRALR